MSVVRLAEYQPPAWRVVHADLVFDLDPDRTVVQARLTETLQGQHTPAEVVTLMNEEINAMIDENMGP